MKVINQNITFKIALVIDSNSKIKGVITDGDIRRALLNGKNLFLESFSKLKSGGIYIIEDVSNSYFEKLFDSLKEYDPEGIVLFDKNQFWYGNNLIIIRKKYIDVQMSGRRSL